MRSGIAAVRAHAQAEAVQKEANRIASNFCSNPNHHARCVRAVVRRLLLQESLMIMGRLYRYKSKSVGAGIYEVTVELMNP